MHGIAASCGAADRSCMAQVRGWGVRLGRYGGPTAGGEVAAAVTVQCGSSQEALSHGSTSDYTARFAAPQREAHGAPVERGGGDLATVPAATHRARAATCRGRHAAAIEASSTPPQRRSHS